MEEIIVQGGNRLIGTVKVEGAKNAVLPILAASLLAEEGTTTLENVPILSDVLTMNEVIRHLNVEIAFDQSKNTITMDASRELAIEAPYEYVSQMRASIVGTFISQKWSCESCNARRLCYWQTTN